MATRIDGNEPGSTRWRQYIWIWVIRIRQLLHSNKDAMQTRIDPNMTHVVSPLPIEAERNPCDYLIRQRIDDGFVLILAVNNLTLIRVSGGSRIGDKNQVIDYIIFQAIGAIIGLEV